MDIEEFHSWIYDDHRFPKRFYAFADIPNITNSGNSQYATCNLCSYVTDEQPFFTEEISAGLNYTDGQKWIIIIRQYNPSIFLSS